MVVVFVWLFYLYSSSKAALKFPQCFTRVPHSMNSARQEVDLHWIPPAIILDGQNQPILTGIDNMKKNIKESQRMEKVVLALMPTSQNSTKMLLTLHHPFYESPPWWLSRDPWKVRLEPMRPIRMC